MNELSVDDILSLSPEAIEALLPDQHPVAYYVYAQRLLQQAQGRASDEGIGDRDAAVFWGYVGQLRYRFLLHTLGDRERAAAAAYFGALQEGIGTSINRAIGPEPQRWWQILGEVLTWDRETRNGYTCTQAHASAWIETRTGLESFRETLARDAEAIAIRFRQADTDLRRVDLATIQPQPWHNGGGLTRKLLQWPTHTSNDTWQLRVSVADIDRSGEFSNLPGLERHFLVLDGAGVTLQWPDASRRLLPGDAAIQFRGESAPMCHLLDGRTVALNLMLRRGAGTVAMHRAGNGTTLQGRTRWRAVYSLAGGGIDIDGVVEPLHAGLLLWTQAAQERCWRLLEDTDAICVTLAK